MASETNNKNWFGSLALNNAALLVFTIAVWVVADPSIQFSTVKVIDDEFPGQLGSWNRTGSEVNTQIEANLIAVTPVEPKRASLYKQYDVGITNSKKQYVQIEGVLTGQNDSDDGAEHESDNTLQQQNKPSIFYAWYENDARERIHIHILGELKNTEDTTEYMARMLIPPTATTISVGLLLRQFEYGFVLEQLRVQQIERTTLFALARRWR